MISTLTERARRILGKRLNYRACYCDPDGSLSRAGAAVMRDLAQFSGAYRTTFRVSPVTRQADALAMARAEGRREMFLRMQAMLKLPDEEFLKSIEDASND